MKFLVLALCVCAASAASFGASLGGYKSYKGKGYQKPVVGPAAYVAAAPAYVAAAPALAAKAVVETAAPVAAAAAAPFVAAGAATYQAGSATYQAAKQVVNQAHSSVDGQATILRSESETSPEGFKFSYETDNGISADAVGVSKQVGEATVIVSQGSYRYTAPDGTPVIVTYTADENGYQPQSDLLPVGPEIPEAILRSIAYNAAHATKETVQY